MRRVIGIDVHRTFQGGGVLGRRQAPTCEPHRYDAHGLKGFGKAPPTSDEMVIEATANSMGVSRVLTPFVARVISPIRQIAALAVARELSVRRLPEACPVTAQIGEHGFPFSSPPPHSVGSKPRYFFQLKIRHLADFGLAADIHHWPFHQYPALRINAFCSSLYRSRSSRPGNQRGNLQPKTIEFYGFRATSNSVVVRKKPPSQKISDTIKQKATLSFQPVRWLPARPPSMTKDTSLLPFEP